jgi:hypothetical protein
MWTDTWKPEIYRLLPIVNEDAEIKIVLIPFRVITDKERGQRDGSDLRVIQCLQFTYSMQ